MEGDGLLPAYMQRIVPATGTVFFAKALNRSVTGNMNEMVAEAKCAGLEDGTVSPFDAGMKLNDLLRSTLTGPDGQPYDKPREAMKRLFDSGVSR